LLTANRRAKLDESDPRRDIPNLLWMYQEGQLELEELITSTKPSTRWPGRTTTRNAGRIIRSVSVLD
jgi:Zn-dependent alcohol dehydrogenase